MVKARNFYWPAANLFGTARPQPGGRGHILPSSLNRLTPWQAGRGRLNSTIGFVLVAAKLRLGSNCSTMLVQHIVNFSLVKQEQRGCGRKQLVMIKNVKIVIIGL